MGADRRFTSHEHQGKSVTLTFMLGKEYPEERIFPGFHIRRRGQGKRAEPSPKGRPEVLHRHGYWPAFPWQGD